MQMLNVNTKSFKLPAKLNEDSDDADDACTINTDLAILNKYGQRLFIYSTISLDFDDVFLYHYPSL